MGFGEWQSGDVNVHVFSLRGLWSSPVRTGLVDIWAKTRRDSRPSRLHSVMSDQTWFGIQFGRVRSLSAGHTDHRLTTNRRPWNDPFWLFGGAYRCMSHSHLESVVEASKSRILQWQNHGCPPSRDLPQAPAGVVWIDGTIRKKRVWKRGKVGGIGCTPWLGSLGRRPPATPLRSRLRPRAQGRNGLR